MDFCPYYSKVAWTRDHRNGKRTSDRDDSDTGSGSNRAGDKSVLFTRLRCGQWSCPYCVKKEQAIWRGFLHDRLPEVSNDWHMLTLTAHSKKRSTEESYRNLQQGIDVFMKRAKRVHGELEYVRTFEIHPASEALHAHFIIAGFSPFVVPGCWRNLQPGYLAVLVRQWRVGVWSLQTWLKRTAHECGMGYMADAKILDPHTGTNYVTKYLTKDQQNIGIKGLRHVQTTRGIGSPQVKAEYKWTTGDFVTARDFKAGENVVDLQTGEIVQADYWDTFDYYPPEMT